MFGGLGLSQDEGAGLGDWHIDCRFEGSDCKVSAGLRFGWVSDFSLWGQAGGLYFLCWVILHERTLKGDLGLNIAQVVSMKEVGFRS